MNLAYRAVTVNEVVQPFLGADAAFEEAALEGGAWAEASDIATIHIALQNLDFAAATFDADSASYPMQFQPYLSLQFHDGRGSNLPWLQELPDPASSGIWGLPVEIDPATAAKLQIGNGDVVRVQSPHGSVEAPAYVHPAAIPGVVSMAIGDGHTHYGRFASGRGANPLSILAPVWEKSTGAFVPGATRVRLSRVDRPRNWIQFSAPDREERDFGHR
jgi:molybdopterin-containing oxidoreductase family iron-sulfur binding subunit